MMRDIEQADGIRLAMCPHCSRPHLLLYDDDGNIFAEIVLSDEIGRQLIEWLQQALYQRAVFRDERSWPRDDPEDQP
jgi:hypothetical protein